MGGIYEIFCIKTGKRYIGSSKDMNKRWQSHLNSLRRGDHHNYYLQKDFLRYGEDNFIFSIIEIVEDETNLYKREELFINSFKFNRLYNSMRKPGEIPRYQSRWMQKCGQDKRMKEEWAFGD